MSAGAASNWNMASSTFDLDVAECCSADLGASTGGFTDCLLQHGAARVYAVDVGQASSPGNSARILAVVVMEKTNARDLTPAQFPPALHARWTSWSSIARLFRSGKFSVPPLHSAAAPVKSLALIKPQFEAGKAEADKGAGVITDPAIHERVLQRIARNSPARSSGSNWRGVRNPRSSGRRETKNFWC